MIAKDFGDIFVQSGEDTVFPIIVQPRAASNQISGILGGEVKIKVTSPPIDGAANNLCREFFAKLLHIGKSKVTIISGEKSRHKVMKIEGIKSSKVAGIILTALDEKR
ncbi:MAG: DUF167 domain-containing protein [Desulfuromonadales bacterium]|nr:DUF167 domain-containing protein [Desulfuromonadales bacterium]